jgi:hypothetical protein
MRRSIALLVTALAGCEPPARTGPLPGEACGLIFDRQVACADEGSRKRLAIDRKEVVAGCKSDAARSVVDDHAALRCLELSDCREFTGCIAQLERQRSLRRLKIEVVKAVRNGGSDDEARLACTTHGRDDAEIEHLCDELYALMHARALADLERVRDGSDVSDHRGGCQRQLDDAAKISPEARAEVALLCEEIAAAALVKEAMGDAQLARFSDTPKFPATCETTLARLDQLKSPWAAQARRNLARTCYVMLGGDLLPRLVAKSRCEPPLDRLVAEVRRYGFADPGIDRWMARAERTCARAAK